MNVPQPFKPEPIIDRPFAPALHCIMDLPFPPSTNSIWRQSGNGVILSGVYKAWKKEADMAVIANGCWRKRVAMPGPFEAMVLLDRALRTPAMDVDNRIKAVLDWAQRVELVVNDSRCEDVHARWVATTEAPRGARLILRSIA